MDTLRGLQRLLIPVMARIRRVCLGSIIRRVDDSGPLQQMQVESLGHSVYDNVEKFGQFGFTSNPPLGSDAIIIERCGKHIILGVGDRKYRIKNLESGDTAIYDIRGQIVKLNADGITINDAFGNSVITNDSGINITDKNGNNITMESGGINLNGVVITQNGTMTTPSTITAGADIISGTGKTMDTHVHTFPYLAGTSSANGTTNPPSA